MTDKSLRNLIILLPVVLMVAFASHRLYEEYRVNEDEAEEALQRELIGELVVAQNTVKRQFNNDILWNSIESKGSLYNKDAIRTGKDSTAVIKLSDASVIEVGENSLIVLDKSQQSFNVDFKAGDITTKNTSANLNVKMKDSTIRGQGAEMKLKSAADGKASVEVTKGKALLTDKTRNTRELGPSELAGVSETGPTQVTKLEIHLKSPEHRSKALSSEIEILQPFTWEVVGTQVKEEIFELSKSSEFPRETTQFFKGHQAVSLKLKHGTYYWRVGWKDKAGAISYTDFRQLVVTADKRIELIEPENELSMEMEPHENKMDFRWKSQIPAKVYVMEVSTQSDFKQIVSNKPINTTFDSIKDLTSGHYFWRVKAFGDKNEELAVSKTNSFAIKLKLPKIPELVKPMTNAVWSQGEPVSFTWRKHPKAAEYKFIVSRSEDLKDVVKTITTEREAYSWNWENQGTFYWSVKAFDENQKNLIGQSEVRPITIRIKDKGPAIELTFPKDTVEITRPMADTTDPILFQWQVLRPLPGPVSLLISDTPDFEKPQSYDLIKTKSHPVSLQKPGSYYWKVVSRSPSSQKEEVSETNTFNFKKVNTLPPPMVINPEHKSKVDYASGVTIKFEWKPVEKASQYHIVLYQPSSSQPEGRALIMDRIVKETTLTSQALPKGDYKWTISSLDEEGQEGLQSSAYDFTLDEPELIEAPVINAPVVK